MAFLEIELVKAPYCWNVELLNHNSLAYTKRYIGITDEELEAVVRKLNL